MRVDKYLKVSRLIKRRTVAKAAAEAARVEVNGRMAKPSSDVQIGDRLTLDYSGHVIEVEVCSIDPRGRKGEEYYRILSDLPKNPKDRTKPSD